MLGKSKILIVDDEPRLCTSLKTLLRTQDYEVQTCNSGNEALYHLKKDKFDLVLLDIFMGAMDGFQLIEKITNDNIDTSIIIMTGNASTGSAVKALRMGANDYLKKPFEPEEFFKSVKNVLDQRILMKKNEMITRKLIESENKFSQIYNNILDVYYEASLDGIILEISPSIEKYSLYKREELIGKSLYTLYTNPSKRDQLIEILIQKGSLKDYELRISDKDDTQHICSFNAELIKDNKGNPLKTVGMFRDITERKHAEEQRTKLIEELQKALLDVKILRGLLPICSHCKNIRNDKGYWSTIESYIEDRSTVEFSHSICQACAKKHYPDFDMHDDNGEVTEG
jgi:PAS domain S-box-containing protein